MELLIWLLILCVTPLLVTEGARGGVVSQSLFGAIFAVISFLLGVLAFISLLYKK